VILLKNVISDVQVFSSLPANLVEILAHFFLRLWILHYLWPCFVPLLCLNSNLTIYLRCIWWWLPFRVRKCVPFCIEYGTLHFLIFFITPTYIILSIQIKRWFKTMWNQLCTQILCIVENPINASQRIRKTNKMYFICFRLFILYFVAKFLSANTNIWAIKINILFMIDYS
jgi:hypothetical protein